MSILGMADDIAVSMPVSGRVMADSPLEERVNTGIKDRFFGFLQRHKMYGYIGANILEAFVSAGVGIAAKEVVPADFFSQFGNYAPAAVMSTASRITSLVLDLTVMPKILFSINKDIYTDRINSSHSTRRKEFGLRYVGYVALSRGFEWGTGILSLNYLLNHNFNTLIAGLANGKLTAPVTMPINGLAYHLMVLKSNPLPALGRQVARASHAALGAAGAAGHSVFGMVRQRAYAVQYAVQNRII